MILKLHKVNYKENKPNGVSIILLNPDKIITVEPKVVIIEGKEVTVSYITYTKALSDGFTALETVEEIENMINNYQ